jgi:TolA-binding protein|tara:strand:- start:53 stop:928 length:876 start_codon:yes stop_codon:yes gene_type:complete
MFKPNLISIFSLFVLLTVSISVPLKAQTAPGSEIFFLDLGIAIEPSSGSEKYSRTIDKPSEEVTFKVKKVESGSVYMASSEELITTLNRLNDRIEQLETSFNTEIVSIRQKNENLQSMLADVSSKLTKQQIDFAAAKKQSEISKTKSPDTNQINISVLNISSNNQDAFDQSLYMSGVFAYQNEDYGSALEKFSMLNFEEVPSNTFENILYWMADSYQHTGQYKEAFGLLNKLTTVGKTRIDDALIQMGLLHKKMGQNDLAEAAFHDVVAFHPESEYVRLAQMEINKDSIKQ